MTHKTLALGLSVALLVSVVGGAFDSSPARADYYPYPGAHGLYCTPSTQSADSGEWVGFSAGYEYDQYQSTNRLTWSAVGGHPSTGTGSTFDTRFFTSSINETRVVTVSDGFQTASCVVYVFGYSPTPTPAYNWFSMDHSVRNLDRSGSGTSVNAHNGDRLQFITKITTGPQYAEDVHIRDWLPQYVNYVYGSTTLDGASYQDGITTGHSGDSLALGTLNPDRTYTVRFEAIVSGAPKTTLTNSVNVHVRGLTDQNRTSTIRITGTSATPTPTVTVTPTPYPGNGQLALTLAGRNLTAGQSGEYATVHARGGDTLEFILRVRSQSGGYLGNVFVTDYLPSGVAYIGSSTALNGYVVADGITSTGLNIGTLAPWQTATVKFSVRVDYGSVPTVGQVSASNTAQARADGAGSTSARMTVTLGQHLTLAAAGINTGLGDSLLLALLASLLVTGIYAGYTRTGAFGSRAARAEIARLARKTEMNFVR